MTNIKNTFFKLISCNERYTFSQSVSFDHLPIVVRFLQGKLKDRCFNMSTSFRVGVLGAIDWVHAHLLVVLVHNWLFRACHMIRPIIIKWSLSLLFGWSMRIKANQRFDSWWCLMECDLWWGAKQIPVDFVVAAMNYSRSNCFIQL